MRNFDSTIPVDVVRMKYDVYGIFNPMDLPVRVSVNKPNLVSNRKVPGFVGMLRNCRGLGMRNP